MECEGKCPCHPKGTSTEHSESKKGVVRSGSLQDCNRICPKLLKPVCGSNGETYDNDYTCNITKVIYLCLTSVELYIHNLKFS